MSAHIHEVKNRQARANVLIIDRAIKLAPFLPRFSERLWRTHSSIHRRSHTAQTPSRSSSLVDFADFSQDMKSQRQVKRAENIALNEEYSLSFWQRILP